jgi:hypothetical protein
MAAITERKGDFIDRSQRGVTFALSLVAVYVVPMLIISSVIIACQATGLLDPNRDKIEAVILWVGGVVMNISTELASAGSFKLARSMEAKGHTAQAGQVRLMGWILLIVVLTTICFEKFGVTGAWNDTLIIVRIASALVYALIADAHGDDRVTSEQQNQIQAMFHEFRTQQVEGMVTQCLDKFQKSEAAQAGQNEAKMRQLVEEMMHQYDAKMVQVIEEVRQQSEAKMVHHFEKMRQQNEALAATVKQQQSELQKQAKAAQQETPRPSTPAQPASDRATKSNIVNFREVNKDAVKAEAYRLTDQEGLSSRQVAERINKPASTVQRWLRERDTGIIEDATGTEE